MDGAAVPDNRVVAVIQARTGSTRLPGKVLYDIAGEPLLGRVIDRTLACTMVDDVVVATSNRDPDAAVSWFANRHGVGTFRGDEEDVLGRYHDAIKPGSVDTIVRLTADNPLIAPEIVDYVVRRRVETGADYCSTSLEDTFPAGIGCESFTPQSLQRVQENASSDYDREHVTPYYRKNPDHFHLESVTSADVYDTQQMKNRTDLRLTVDTPSDYAFMSELLERLDEETTVPLSEVIEFIDTSTISWSDGGE